METTVKIVEAPTVPFERLVFRLSFALALACATWTALPAQTVNPPKPASESPSEIVELSAFEVQADSDNSYGALNSTSLTRFKVELDKMPVSADVFTETFMKDVAATSVEEVIQNY